MILKKIVDGLYLTKLNGGCVDFQVEIPEHNKLISLDPEGKVKVKFVFPLGGKR